MTALTCVFIIRAGFTISERLAALIVAFRGLIGVRLRYGPHRALHGASLSGYPVSTPAQLHVHRYFTW